MWLNYSTSNSQTHPKTDMLDVLLISKPISTFCHKFVLTNK